MIIRVNEDNLEEAAKIHSESWIESHRSFCSKEFIELHSTANQRGYLQKEMNNGKSVYMLIEDKPVGIVSIKDSLIENLYVLPDEQEKGYGTKLLLFAMKHCDGEPTLWILCNNKRAYELYSRHGFVKTGRTNQLSEELYELEMKICDVCGLL